MINSNSWIIKLFSLNFELVKFCGDMVCCKVKNKKIKMFFIFKVRMTSSEAQH